MADSDVKTIQRILEINVGDSEKSVKSLKVEISDLRDALLNVDETSEEYKKGVELLQSDQRELNKVMALTKSNAEAVKGSYYDLNNQLVQAKKEWKNLTEEQRIADKAMGEQGLFRTINRLSDELKDLDASIGDHQRSVGDYTDSIKKAFEGAELSSSVLGKSIKNLDASAKLFSKNPILSVLTLLLPLITKIVGAVKENTTAMDALNKMMTSMQPIMDMATAVINKLAQAFAWLAEKITTIVNKLFKNKGDTLNAAVEENAEVTETATESNNNYAKSLDKVAQSAEKAKFTLKDFEETMKLLEQKEKKEEEARKKRLEEEKAVNAELAEDYQQTYDEIGSWIDEQLEQERASARERWELEQNVKAAKQETAWAMVESTSSILASMGDMFQQTKAYAVASSIIDTISGAIKAYMACQDIPAPFGQIIGAANAAAVSTAGMAQVSKLRGTSAGTSSVASVSFSTAGASVGGVDNTSMQTYRNITSASEETRLNEMAFSKKKVYLVYSDVQAMEEQVQVVNDESSF